MNKNDSRANTDSFSATVAKSVLDFIMGRKTSILETVQRGDPQLHAGMEKAIDAPLSHPPGSRPGKFHRIEKLVDIWMVFKQVDTLLSDTGGTRSTSLITFIDIMTRFEGLASEAVSTNMNKHKSWKSVPMPVGEKTRGHLMGGGTKLDARQYPFCPNKNCNHPFIDQPPGNVTVVADNSQTMSTYMESCKQFKAWKRDEGPQPMCPDTNQLLTKMPSAPKTKKRHMRCHCGTLFSDPRNGKQCPVSCHWKGVRFRIGSCPICLCVCQAFIPLDQFQTIMTVSSLEKRDAPNQRAQSSEWLEQNTNVNLTQQRTSAEYYRRMTNSGGTDRGVSVVGNVSNEGALAQSLNMVGNPPPNPLTTQHLRQAVDGVQHPAGPSHTNIGDMNTHGRDSAADRRKTNNGLLSTCVPHSMTDAQQLVAAMAENAHANSTNTNSPNGLTDGFGIEGKGANG